MHDFHFLGGGWMMILLWILIIAIILITIGVIMRGRTNQSNSKKESPLEILKERYAKGEISKEEFKERKSELTNS